MSDRQASCEDRIDDQLRSTLDSIGEFDRREKRIRRLQERADGWLAQKLDELYEENDEERRNYALSVSGKRIITVQLSWGGPSDEFQCVVDVDERGIPAIERITYRFMDWFDGASRELLGSDFDTAQAFCEPFVEYAVAE